MEKRGFAVGRASLWRLLRRQEGRPRGQVLANNDTAALGGDREVGTGGAVTAERPTVRTHKQTQSQTVPVTGTGATDSTADRERPGERPEAAGTRETRAGCEAPRSLRETAAVAMQLLAKVQASKTVSGRVKRRPRHGRPSQAPLPAALRGPFYFETTAFLFPEHLHCASASFPQ